VDDLGSCCWVFPLNNHALAHRFSFREGVVAWLSVLYRSPNAVLSFFHFAASYATDLGCLG
jgi:hypothetical protein